MKLNFNKFKLKKKIKPEVKEEKPKENNDPIVVESKEPKGLKAHLKEVNEKLDVLTKRDKKTEIKEFKLPSKVARQLKKLAIKNKLMVLFLTRNRSLIPQIAEIRDGFININGRPYNCSNDFIFLWKGKHPAIVLKEWDMNPIGTADYYDAVAKGRTPDPIAIAIRMIESAENKEKKTLSPKAWIFIGLAIIAGLYILIGGG